MYSRRGAPAEMLLAPGAGGSGALRLPSAEPVLDPDARIVQPSEFLTAVLRGEDPVTAANARVSKTGQAAAYRAQSKKFSDFASVVVTANYSTWVTTHQPSAGLGEGLRRALDLDRETHRALFKTRVDEMLFSGSASDVRIQVVVAFGAEGNHMEKASEQLHDHYEKNRSSSKTPINRHRLRPHPEALMDRLALESAITRLPPSRWPKPPRDVGSMLEAVAPVDLDDGAHRMVWLDCGVLRFRSPLKQAKASLDAFFLFLRDVIAPTVKTVRVIGFLAVEAEDTTLVELQRHLDTAEKKDWPSSMELNLLGPFGAATRAELTRFLKRGKCPEGILSKVVGALLARTRNGRYEDLVRELDRASALGGYPALLDALNEESACDEDPAKKS